MKKQTIAFIVLILCVLGARAEDSIKVSAADLQALVQRVERLEQKAEKDSVSPKVGRKGAFTIGGYGEVTAKHCWFSNNYLRYGKNPEKYANDHYGEFDLPHVVIYLGYDFGKGWSVGTEIELDARARFSAVAAAVKARKNDLNSITQDQINFEAQKNTAGGKKTMKAYLWKVCGDIYDAAHNG